MPPSPYRLVIPHREALYALSHFYTKVEKTESCWLWKAQITTNGYGQIHWFVNGEDVKVAAHRFSYILHNGGIPDGLEIDHLCRNRACVNPAHLEAVTREVNIRRGISPAAQRAKQTHCKRGHPLSGDNLVPYKKWRVCRICMTMMDRLWRERNKKCR